MIELELSSRAPQYHRDPVEAEPQVRTVHVPGTQRHPPSKAQTILTFAVYRVGDERCPVDYFASRKGEWYEHTTLSLASSRLLSEADIKELQEQVERFLNAHNGKRTWFVEIMDDLCNALPDEYDIIGHSSYVPS